MLWWLARDPQLTTIRSRQFSSPWCCCRFFFARSCCAASSSFPPFQRVWRNSSDAEVSKTGSPCAVFLPLYLVANNLFRVGHFRFANPPVLGDRSRWRVVPDSCMFRLAPWGRRGEIPPLLLSIGVFFHRGLFPAGNPKTPPMVIVWNASRLSRSWSRTISVV